MKPEHQFQKLSYLYYHCPKYLESSKSMDKDKVLTESSDVINKYQNEEGLLKELDSSTSTVRSITGSGLLSTLLSRHAEE